MKEALEALATKETVHMSEVSSCSGAMSELIFFVVFFFVHFQIVGVRVM